jgi:putative intracellular protease/amidase
MIARGFRLTLSDLCLLADIASANEVIPQAAICHAPRMILEASEAKGLRITSWPLLKTELKNASAEWVDEEMVHDRNVVSSRKPDDIPAFNRGFIELFAEAKGASAKPLKSSRGSAVFACAPPVHFG